MDQYRLVRELGKGGCGRALLVKNIQTKEKMVIKEIDLDNTDEKVRASAMNEIKIIQCLKHDNIISISGASVQKGKVLILMEYADAGDLANLIDKQGQKFFHEEQILDIFVQICLAVKYIHDRKIIHRDLKPSNVFMCKGGIVKLGDFGFAKGLSCTAAEAYTMIGTPYYVAPEIVLGKGYGAPADIWSLGCILYELTSLRPPFDGNDVPGVMAKIVSLRAPKVSSRYSDDIRNLVGQMLSKDPQQRPTINQILSVPIVRFKAVALLGMNVADLELGHETFHGEAAGVTPKSAQEKLGEIKLAIAKEATCEFLFMGRPLDLEGRSNPADVAKFVDEFIKKIVGDAKYAELQNAKKADDLPHSEKCVIELIGQLESYKEENGLH